MRVLHWYPNFHAGGGVANSVLALANAQASAGIDVAIASLARGRAIYGPLKPQDGVKLATWHGRGRVGKGGVELHFLTRGARRSLKALGPQVVHIHGEFNPDNWWAPRLWGCPLVLSPHGAFHAAVLTRRLRTKRLYIAMAQKALYRNVSRFHALNPAEAADIAAALPSAHTYCAMQGPSPVLAELPPGMPEAAPEQAGDPVRFMFVGRIDVRTKGLDILLEAFALAIRDPNHRRSATLTLVGPDWRKGKAPLQRLARRLGMEDRVDIREPVPQRGVPDLLSTCHVYVQLSRHEGSPLSVNDALSLGKPLIVSSRVGTASWSQIAGLPHVQVVEPSVSSAARAIGETLANLESFQRAAHETYPEVVRFLSWETAAQRHLDEYKSLVCDSSVTRPGAATELAEAR